MFQAATDTQLFQVFGGAKKSGTIEGFDDQLNIFRSAEIIIGALRCMPPHHRPRAGPHGAGLANMLFAKRNVSVIEFAMKPHCNRCFGYMAMALEVDYWLVPQLACNYHLKYTLDRTKIDATLRVLRHVLERKGLGHLLRRDEL